MLFFCKKTEMFKYLLKRVLEAIPVLWVIATLTFFMLQAAPGGPFDKERALPPDVEAALQEIIATHSSHDPRGYLKSLRKSGRYLRDVY